jgi:hypothetical protein
MQINKRRLAKRTGISLLLFLLLVGTVAYTMDFYERWRAEQLLSLLRETKVGVTTEAEFRAAASRHLRFTRLHGAWGNQENWDGKDPNPIVTFVVVGNTMARLGLAPGAVLYANVAFEKGRVCKKWAGFGEGSGPIYGGSVEESVRGYGQVGGVESNDSPHHRVHVSIGRIVDGVVDDKTWFRIFINDDDQATDAEKQADWHFKLACMTKIGGCRDARELLPDARRTTIPADVQNQ